MSAALLAAEAARTGTGEAVTFWVLAVVVVLGALGVIGSPKAVYSAVFLAMTMIVLAVFYVMQGALFLGVVQIVVYTGAVMMLFLFVLMLIGVDSSESLVETIRGQRVLGTALGAGFAVLLIAAIGHASLVSTGTAGPPELSDQSIRALAELIFVDYLWAFELTGALLITATLGAMILAHRQRLTPKPGQRELSIRRFADGGRATPLPPPGVFARHNAVDVPALEPDGTPSAQSVNALLSPRDLSTSSRSEGRGSRSEGRGSGSEGRGTRSEGRGTRSEGRGTRSEGRGSGSEGRGTRSEGRGTRSEGRGTRSEGRGSGSEGRGTRSEPESSKSEPEGSRSELDGDGGGA